MKRYCNKTIEGALSDAAKDLDCFVVDLKYEVVQCPRSGFFGIGARDAVILAQRCSVQNQNQNIQNDDANNVSETLEILSPNLTQRKRDIDVESIKSEIVEMLTFLPYEITKVEVFYSQNTLTIELDGADAPLIIGEKGYRYRALSYLLFNWIYPKYGCNLRLEVAQFLKIQEEIIFQYLDSIDDEICKNKTTTTKNLNKIMQIIALQHLRAKYPGSYIYIKKEANSHEAPIAITHLK
ncbi:MAG: Jag N-terminal domain-containing protein [Helicobacter sp.]|nr:Jag N-terminal domain-containing protein [Helicobacter sp.]